MELAQILDKKSYNNWDNKPKNRATMYKNIKRVLDIFKTKKSIKLSNLLAYDEILSGNGEVIRSLLLDLKEA